MKAILILVLALSACAPARSATEHVRDAAPWQAVLRRLDAERERAYVRGDPALLDRVYVPRVAVRRADARLVRAYERRGLELDAVPMRIRDVEVMAQTQRRVRLRVVDRLGALRVRGVGEPWRLLPRDRPSEHLITMLKTDAGWRIAGIRRVAG